jgi:hypothetical protein
MESNIKLILLFAIFIAIIFYTKIENFARKVSSITKKANLNRPIVGKATITNKDLKPIVKQNAKKGKGNEPAKRAVLKNKNKNKNKNKTREKFSEISDYSEISNYSEVSNYSEE